MLGWAGMCRARPCLVGPGWAQLGWTGLGWAALGWAGRGWGEAGAKLTLRLGLGWAKLRLGYTRLR